MKEALKLALEALENALNKPMWDRPKMTKTITAIKEALAQPEQEPVAWEQFYPDIGKPQLKQEPVALVVSTAPDRIWLDLGFDPQEEYEVIFHELHDVTWSQDNASGNGIEYVRADTTPPKRPWVGLTDEDIALIDWESLATKKDCARAIEAKLKEKNT